MTRGSLIWIDDEKGNCSLTGSLNGDMGPEQTRGRLAITRLQVASTRELFVKVAEDFLNLFGRDISEYDDPLYHSNVIEKPFQNIIVPKECGTYFRYWHSDYLYVVNMTSSDIKTLDYNGNEVVLKRGFLTILDYGKFESELPIMKLVPAI